MKLSQRPNIVYMHDPDYGNRPHPYVFAGIPNSLDKMDLGVSYLNTASATLESFRKDIDAAKPDLLLGFVQDRVQVKKVSNFLKEYHPVPAVNWFQEEPNFVAGRDADDSLLDGSSSFDMWFGIDSNMLPYWRTKAVFMPPAYDDNIYHDQGLERSFDVSYIGKLGRREVSDMYWPYMCELARYGKKAMMCIDRPMGLPLLSRPLESLLRSKKGRRFLQKLPVWRCGWQNPKDEEEKALVINRSKIHFGLNRVRGNWEDNLKALIPDYPRDEHGLFYQLKGRPFQAAGAGAMVLNEYCPELEDMFEIGREIVTFEYGNVEEVKDKLSWYIAHDGERERIARAGNERGKKQHTYAARVRQILEIVGREL